MATEKNPEIMDLKQLSSHKKDYTKTTLMVGLLIGFIFFFIGFLDAMAAWRPPSTG